MASLIQIAVSENAIEDNEVVAAVTDRVIAVISYVLSASGGANIATWKSATTVKGGPFSLGALETIGAVGRRDVPQIVTAPGEALNLALTAATVVSGHITYMITDTG